MNPGQTARLRPVAALCVSGRSIYKHTAGVVAFDAARDMRTFKGGMPVIAHPPCRCWSKYLRHQAKPPDRAAEMQLGRDALRWVLECGGILEHPAGSLLFADQGLPVPTRPAHAFCYTLAIDQQWFGYATPKPTWVLVVGVPRHQLPVIPFRLRRPGSLAGLSKAGRSRTIPDLADWFCQVARSTWFSHGVDRSSGLALAPETAMSGQRATPSTSPISNPGRLVLP